MPVRDTVLAVYDRTHAYIETLKLGPNTPIQPHEDSAALYLVGVEFADLAAALKGAAELVGLGASVVVRLAGEAETCELTSRTSGRWMGEGPITSVLPFLPTELREQWSTDELLAGAPEPFSGSLEVRFEKEPWVQAIGQETGRAAWIGGSVHSFVSWLSAPLLAAWSPLLEQPGGLILLHDWQQPPAHLGPRLVLGGIATTAAPPPPDPGWPLPPDQVHLPLLRAIEVDADEAPGELSPRLSALIGEAAGWLLAEERTEEGLRPDRLSTTRWPNPAASIRTSTPVRVAAVVALARWVIAEPNASRLSVARHVAASRIPDALNGAPPGTTVELADISYAQIVDETVRKGLDAQAELERSFRSFDSDLSSMQTSIEDSVDDAVTKGLGGALAITVGALTIPAVRGWPTAVASLFVAAYVGFVAYWRVPALSLRALDRLTGFRQLVARRAFALGGELDASLTRWQSKIYGRKQRFKGSLTVLLVVLLVIAGIGGFSTYSTDRKPPRPPLPSPSSTP